MAFFWIRKYCNKLVKLNERKDLKLLWNEDDKYHLPLLDITIDNETERPCVLDIKILKTLNGLNPEFIKDFFSLTL